MKLKIGTIFRYPKEKNRSLEKIDGYPNFSYYTNFPNTNFVLLESGINPIAKVKNNNVYRTPAILTSSSPHKIGSSDTPWQDYYNVSKGHIRYFGDNKDDNDPESKKGNKALLREFEIHNSSDPKIRKTACPIIFFKRVQIKNKVKGYVEFNGFGVITHAEKIVQFNRKSNRDFVNYRFDFAVLEIIDENEKFEWDWINSRRDKNKSLEDTIKASPNSWRRWIKKGHGDLHNIRRNVLKLQVLSEEEQKPKPSSKEFNTLNKILKFYKSPSSKKRFENLASIVAEHYLTKTANYKSGWITKGSGDAGIDFIGRMDVGSGFGSAKIIVLGQAKCVEKKGADGADVSRTVAKLKRGWLGVFVTTSHFTTNAQIEILEDKYPLLLINGKTLAEEVNEIIYDNGYTDVNKYLSDIDYNKESIQTLEKVPTGSMVNIKILSNKSVDVKANEMKMSLLKIDEMNYSSEFTINQDQSVVISRDNTDLFRWSLKTIMDMPPNVNLSSIPYTTKRKAKYYYTYI